MIDKTGRLHLIGSAAAQDKLFIQEILNDLHKQGIDLNDGGNKAVRMLKDWAIDLNKKAPAIKGKTKFFHALIVGKQYY